MKAAANVWTAKRAATFWKFLLRTRYQKLCWAMVIARFVLSEKRVVTTKTKSHLHFRRNFSANQNQPQPSWHHKRQKSFHFKHNRFDTSLVDAVKEKFIIKFVLYTFSLQWSNIFFSVSNDGCEWSVDFGPDTVTLTVRNIFHEKSNFPREASGSLKLVVVSTTRLLEQPSSASSNYPQPKRDYGDGEESVLKWRCTKYGHKRV